MKVASGEVRNEDKRRADDETEGDDEVFPCFIKKACYWARCGHFHRRVPLIAL